jgi:uncharacterized protein YukE
MKHADVTADAAKIELALKTFRTTFAAIEPQWTDAARRDFQETYVTPLEPNVRNMLEAIARLAEVFAAAARQCDSDERTRDE